MPKRERPTSEEFGVETKRSKKVKYAQLTSNPTDLAFLLKQIELSEEDVIKGYLSEANGEEILALLETGFKRKSNELAIIFRVLATIIIRTRKDLNEVYGEVGRRLAEGVLEDAPLAFCFRALKPQGSAEAAKASLQLLSAVVSTDALLFGRNLLRSVNFEHPDWIYISRRRNTKDPIDVRTCFINFIASFLVSENNLLIRELLESKNAVNLLLGGCFIDKTENVLLILNLLRKSVCDNPAVSKTIKMRIFTRNALKQLGYLYAYRGEALSEKSAFSRTDAEVDFQTVELVRESVHSLLLPLVTSTSLGLVFRERASLENGGKQNGHLLWFLLSPPMENAFTDDLRRQLVTECLLACPVLLPSYLIQLSASMAPRDTENWHNMMMFVNQLFSMFQAHLVGRVSQLLELSQDMAEFVQSIADLCLPPSCIVDILNRASQHESTSVSKAASSIYKSLRQNMRIFLTWLHTTEELKPKGASAQPIVDTLSDILPERIVNEKWRKKFRKILQKQHTDLSLLKSQFFPSSQEQVGDEVVEDSKAEEQESSKLPQPEEVISEQSKKLRSSLLELQNLSNYPNSEFPQKREKHLVKIWPELATACLNDLSSGSVVLLNCLATAIRVLSKNYWNDKGKELNPTPKILLNKIGTRAAFKSILSEEPIIELAGNKQGIFPTLPLKAALLNLLLALGEADPNSTAKTISTVALLAAYKASLSTCDCRSLQLLHLLDLNGHPLAGTWGMTNRNVIWGSRILDHYSIGSILGETPHLRREPNSGAFLGILDADKLLANALTFPVTRRCLSRAFSADTSPLNPNQYDPCFLLPLFLQYLSSDDPDEELHPSQVDIRGFYSRGCLAFTVGALSSYSRHIRSLAKSVIARFRTLSEAWKPTRIASVPLAIAAMKQFPERVQLNFMLDCLRNSLSHLAIDLNGGIRSSFLFGSKADTPFRLTRVHANFFINALTMLSKPEHRMYEVFWNAFMAKPAIDLGALPDFMRTIFSVHKDFRVDRQWVMKLCADSLNDTSDYLVLEKSRVYKYCLVLYADPAVDATTQIQILRLLTATTKIPRACHALMRFHAFPLWLFRHALSTTHAPSLCYFLTIIEQMRSAFEETKDENPSLCLPMLRLLDVTFRYLYNVLQKNCDASDCNVDEVVESLRLFSEIIVWGDQNDGSIMDFFWEQNALELMIRYIDHQTANRNICIQLLQSLNILFENLTNNRAIYYLLSQNHTNGIILHEFDFSDEEIIGYYIAFLKSLSFRVDNDTINFFFEEASASFPLYQRALQFFDHSESMVRIAVRTITLNIFKVHHEACLFYVYAHTSVPYFSHLTEEIRRTTFTVNDFFCLTNRLANRGRVEDLVAETSDHLHYIDDIFTLGVTDLTNVLCLILLRRLFLPIYVHSLTKRHPPKGSSRGNYLFHVIAMFLLAQVFTILHQPELIRILTEAILIGDLTLLLPAFKDDTSIDSADTSASQSSPCSVSFSVLAFLRAAHHGKRAAKSALPGHRLQAFLQTLTACGIVDSGELSSSLNEDIARCSESIKNFQAGIKQSYDEKPESNQTGLSPSQSSSELTSQIALPPTGLSPLTPRLHKGSSSSLATATATTPMTDTFSSQDNNGGFTLTGRPFLRALFRSLEVGPGTDYDTFFALSLLIAIKRNGGLDEGTLALAQLHTPSKESPCNPMLITKLLDIISDAVKMGSRVRVATLNLALFLLVLVTRDASRMCQLTENQAHQLQMAFLESRNILRDLYQTEPNFSDIFEFELCRYRAQKLDPSKLLENNAFLFSHVEDALKLFSNHSEENLSSSSNSDFANMSARTAQASSQDVPPYTALPFSELESIQRIIAVYLCLKGYLCSYIFLNGEVKCISTSSSEPLNEVTAPGLERVPSLSSFGNIPPSDKVIVAVSEPIDTAQHQIFSCEVVHRNGRSEKRYLIISDVQIILVEPGPHRIGWGIVTFSGFLQDTELNRDPTDGKVLNIVVYKPGDRSSFTVRRLMTDAGIISSSFLPTVFHRLNAKLRFQDALQCSTIHTLVTQHLEKISMAKQEKLRQLLSVQDKFRSSTQTILSKDAPRLQFPLMAAANRSLKTTDPAPKTLLQKAAMANLPSAPQLPIERNLSSQSLSKKLEDGQEIAMVELPKRAVNNTENKPGEPASE